MVGKALTDLQALYVLSWETIRPTGMYSFFSAKHVKASSCYSGSMEAL
ncbi:hypothetical protein FM107_17995 [Sphingobacterium sp. JB170]|nr:hypothetical protein FM107_17995 [Sphingobacterium sp. JB170]